tara:strand:- start:1917 stop:2363 length:447 start_codon:yes stop_codon:yes gene_type:complete
MELLGKKLTLKKDYDDICEICTFSPSQSVKQDGKYEIKIPGVGSLNLPSSAINLLFNILKQEDSTEDSENNKNIESLKASKETKETKEPVVLNIDDRRESLKALKKDELLNVIKKMQLEDKLPSSLKKTQLVEEILKESFGENYKAKG